MYIALSTEWHTYGTGWKEMCFTNYIRPFSSSWYRRSPYPSRQAVIGMPGKVFTWFSSYISGRKQSVVIEGVLCYHPCCLNPLGQLLCPLGIQYHFYGDDITTTAAAVDATIIIIIITRPTIWMAYHPAVIPGIIAQKVLDDWLTYLHFCEILLYMDACKIRN